MKYQVATQQVEAQPIAVVRRQASAGELARVIPDGCGEVWNFFRAGQFGRPGRHVAVYLDGTINLEVGVEVTFPFTANGDVVLSATPAGVVATTVHMGPYGRLNEAHAAIREWCADHQHTIAGPNWEIYGHWNDDPEQLRTDVFYLLA